MYKTVRLKNGNYGVQNSEGKIFFEDETHEQAQCLVNKMPQLIKMWGENKF